MGGPRTSKGEEEEEESLSSVIWTLKLRLSSFPIWPQNDDYRNFEDPNPNPDPNPTRRCQSSSLRKGIRVCHIVVRVILFFFPFFGAIFMILPNLIIMCTCPNAPKSLIG